MAKPTIAKKKVDAKGLSGILAAVNRWDRKAPVGAYKIDKLAMQIKNLRHLPGNAPVWIFRDLVLNCCLGAVHRIISDSEVPKAQTAWSDIYQRFDQIEALANEIATLDPHYILSALYRPLFEGVSPEEELAAIEDDLDDIGASLSSVASKIQIFRQNTMLHDLDRHSNRSDRFTRYFIMEIERCWRKVAGATFCKKDVPLATLIVAAALEDFAYPLTKTQRNSDVWLSDRIRKQTCRN